MWGGKTSQWVNDNGGMIRRLPQSSIQGLVWGHEVISNHTLGETNIKQDKGTWSSVYGFGIIRIRGI